MESFIRCVSKERAAHELFFVCFGTADASDRLRFGKQLI
jgi:hypothetical protein